MEQQATPIGVLPSESAVRLRRLFQFLRVEHRTKYKVIAGALNLDVDQIYRITAGRSSGTYEILRSLEQHMREQGLSFPGDSEEDEQFGLDYVLDALDIDQDIIADSVRYSAGRYLLFSLLASKNIAVTSMELFDISKRLTVPVFKGRRVGNDGRDIIYKGFCYEYLSSLFMFGHIEDTPYARSLVLVPVGGRRRSDRHGVMTGASPVMPYSRLPAICGN